MNAAHLQLVDTETGEVVERKHSHEDLELLVERYKAKLDGALMENGKLRKELAGVRELEPDSKEIREVLEFYVTISGRDRIMIGPETERWAKTRARLRQKPGANGDKWTPARLKTALVGAPKCEWFRDSQDRQDPVVVFAKSENVERCERAAGRPDRPVRRTVVDTAPLDAAVATLKREYGVDRVTWIAAEAADSMVALGPCPLHHETGHVPLRLSETARRGELQVWCAAGCPDGDVILALRTLYGLQAARIPVDEIAELRTRLVELEGALRLYAHSGEQLAGRGDLGRTARLALGWGDVA